jgi:hypothetical protein
MRRRYRRHYYPRRRTAYGPRYPWQPRRHVHALTLWAFSARELRQLGQLHASLFDELPMPRGGVRVVVCCPSCGERRARLYAVTGDTSWPFACRRCAGLVYWRQYEGRRIEADRARIAYSIGRYCHWQEALLTWLEREADYSARADLALTLNQISWACYMASLRRLDELNAAIEHGASYRATKRKSRHTAEIIRLQQRIRELRRKPLHRKAA